MEDVETTQESHTDLLKQAVEIVVKNKKASTSFLQRSLKIGYSRAASLLDALEKLKIVGEQDGAKPRDVLITKVGKKLLKEIESLGEPAPPEPRKARPVREESRKLVRDAAKDLPVPDGFNEFEDKEADEWDEEIDKVPENLTRDEERFCRIYTSATEFFGNGTQSYIEAYDVQLVRGTREKLEKGKRKKLTYESVREMARKLLTNLDILARCDELLEEGGFNDVFVDKQLKFLMTQNADPRVKLGAIQEFNKLKQRIHEKSTLVHQFANEDMSDEELMQRIKKNRAFFKKE